MNHLEQMDELGFEFLTTLAHQPCHGYELKYLLEDRKFINPHRNLYQVLQRLVANELISFQTVASRKGPVKKVYSITEKGEAALCRHRENGAYLVLARYLESLGEECGHFLEEEFINLQGVEISFLGVNRASWPMARPIAKTLFQLSGQNNRPIVLSKYPLVLNLNIDMILGTMTTIPLSDNCIDLAVLPVLTMDTIEYSLEELHRILVLGGFFLTNHPLPSDVIIHSRLAHDLITTIPSILLPSLIGERINLIRELDDYFAVMNISRQDASFLICQKEE